MHADAFVKSESKRRIVALITENHLIRNAQKFMCNFKGDFDLISDETYHAHTQSQ